MVKENLKRNRIRKRIICLGLVLGIAVNQVILFQAHNVLAADNNVTVMPPQYININPVDIINKVDELELKNNNSSHQPIINFDNNKPLVNYSSTVNQYTNSPDLNKANYPMNSQPPNNIIYGHNQNNNYHTPSNAITQYNPNRPEWTEFCPYGLENAQKDDSFHLWATNSRYQAENQNYWVDRRKDFEKHLAYCDKIQDANAQNACYGKIRERQKRITDSYVDPWQKAEIKMEKFRNAANTWLMYDAIKNQNVNVRHSGTVNQNYNVNWHNW